jgi:signal peptidase II
MRLDTPRASRAFGLFASIRMRFAALTAGVAAVDLLSKEVAVRSLGSDGVVSLSDRFSLFVVFNTASAGGVEIGPYTWELNVLVTALAVGLIASVVHGMASVDRRATLALALVAGGGVGNLLSMMFGPEGVADFLAVRMLGDTTIVANVADFALWAGASMLVPVAIVLIRKARAESRALVSPQRS